MAGIQVQILITAALLDRMVRNPLDRMDRNPLDSIKVTIKDTASRMVMDPLETA